MKTLIAVDPGASGGISIMSPSGHVMACNMPETPTDVADVIASNAILSGEAKCYMEEVSGYAGDAQPGSMMFNFGRGFGQIEGILIGSKIPYELIKPQRWQKTLALGTAGRVKGNYAGMTPDQAAAEKKRIKAINYTVARDWKNKLKAMAQRLFPQLKVTLATCDSLLLLEYARRMEGITAVAASNSLTTAITPQPQLL